MTTDPASMSLNDLMHEFRSGAKLTGTAYNSGQSPERFKRSAERATSLTRMQALGAELRARRAVEAFRELMVEGDLDIRGWAAAQSMSVLPDLADATLSGLLVGRSGPEILDLIRRARSKPPKDPPLSAMTTDALVSRFEDACEREYATRFVGDGDSPPGRSVAKSHRRRNRRH